MIANIVTSLRIVGTLCLLFTQPLSKVYYIIYAFCGFTDILDGFIARVTHSVSKLGAKLDSIADLLFYTISTILILPELYRRLPVIIWYFVALIVLLRVFSYLYVAFTQHQMASLHTIWNKLTGAAVFLIPFSLLFPAITTPYCFTGLTISAISTTHELSFHLRKQTSKA